jgi:hypothetical protein
MVRGNFDISIFADFTAAEIGKKQRFFGDWAAQKIAPKKSRKRKFQKFP